MTIYSQNDPRWKGLKIGKSDSTLGRYGCTISCLGMLVNLNPLETNDLLTKAESFNGDLIVWSRVELALPQLKFVKRGKTTDFQTIDDYVAEYGGCLVEVDFDGVIDTPADFHWVVYRPEGKLWDPWTGQEFPRSKYKIVKGYSLFKVAKIEDTMPGWLKGLLQENGVSEDQSESWIRQIIDKAKQTDSAIKERDKANRDKAEAIGQAAHQEELLITANKELKRTQDDLVVAKNSVIEVQTGLNACKLELQQYKDTPVVTNDHLNALQRLVRLIISLFKRK